jgi:hypothetical protein
LIGFDRPAITNARNETRMTGDHCTRGSGCAPDWLAKAGFLTRLYFKFHHFPFRFQPLPNGRLFYNQPLAMALRVSGFEV